MNLNANFHRVCLFCHLISNITALAAAALIKSGQFENQAVVMAAEIKPVDQSAGDNGFGAVKRLDLLSKIESMYTVNMAVLMGDDDDGVIGVSEDKSVRIWLKRDRGKYWPSVCQFLPAPATSVFYYKERRLLYIGLNNGTVVEFVVAEDGNKITHVRDVLAHVDKVTCIYVAPTQRWVLTGSRDKFFQWHCSETGRKLGSYLVDVWISCLCFDSASQCVFVGDMSGQITVLKINQSTSLITVLKGHSASVRSLAWDKDRNLLFSGGGDSTIVVWDIGGKKGTTVELSGHQDIVECLLYIPASNQLVSGGADCNIIFWNMDAQRKQMPVWSESNKCECCGGPFFWNFKTMWEIKTIGGRQHHCRKCGRAVCSSCSQKFSILPQYGFEYPVRLCNECHGSLKEEELAPLAMSYHSKHRIISMDVDISKKIILTTGKDKIMKIWEMLDNWN